MIRCLAWQHEHWFPKSPTARTSSNGYVLSSLRNCIAQGDAEEILQELPAESVDLIFTSPPYYNARPEYVDYIGYEEYLLKIRKVLHHAHRVLAEGRFFVMNVSPVLIRRASRSQASKRIAVPFDMHRLFIEEGYDFIDDIIWEKPEGAGWATGRGRRFAADRNPLQYKPVPVTEYMWASSTSPITTHHIMCVNLALSTILRASSSQRGMLHYNGLTAINAPPALSTTQITPSGATAMPTGRTGRPRRALRFHAPNGSPSASCSKIRPPSGSVM